MIVATATVSNLTVSTSSFIIDYSNSHGIEVLANHQHWYYFHINLKLDKAAVSINGASTLVKIQISSSVFNGKASLNLCQVSSLETAITRLRTLNHFISAQGNGLSTVILISGGNVLLSQT